MSVYSSQSLCQLVCRLQQQPSGLVESVSRRLPLRSYPDIAYADDVLVVTLKRGIGAEVGLQLFETFPHAPYAVSYLRPAALVLLGYSRRSLLAARDRLRRVDAPRNASEQVQEVCQRFDLRRDPVAPNLQLSGRDRGRLRRRSAAP